MVSFLRKKSDRNSLSGETVLDRKGKVDGSSLLDGNGDPTSSTLYDMNKPASGGKKNKKNASNQEDDANYPIPPAFPGAAGAYPPPQQYPHGNNVTYPPQQPYGAGASGSYPPHQPAHQQPPYGMAYPPQSYPVEPFSAAPPKKTSLTGRMLQKLPGYGKKKT